MSLLPYSLRPHVLFRSAVIRHGVLGNNRLFRPLAHLLVGQGDFLRAKAIRRGLFLGDPYWRRMGVALVFQAIYRHTFKTASEPVSVERFGVGHNVRVTAIEPTRKRRGRRAERQRLEAEALTSVKSSRRTS